MKFGLSLSCQHPVGDDMVRRLNEHLEQTALARELGFDAGPTYSLRSTRSEVDAKPFKGLFGRVNPL